MTLAEFLETASSDDAVALEEARAYEVHAPKEPIANRRINERTIVYLLGTTAGETLLQTLESLPESLLPSRVKGWFKPEAGGVDVTTVLAQQLLDMMVDNEVILPGQRQMLVNYGYDTTYPFSSVTLYDVKKARETCPTLPISVVDGYAIITTTADCEEHSPQVHALNPRTNKPQRITGFRSVGKAGSYDCLIPPEWRGATLTVDSAYGVFS